MKKYRIHIAPSALRAIKRLDAKTRQRIVMAVDDLADDPRPVGAIQLKGDTNFWRIRIGDYRVVYSIEDKALLVLVVKIGHRKDIYRKRD